MLVHWPYLSLLMFSKFIYSRNLYVYKISLKLKFDTLYLRLRGYRTERPNLNNVDNTDISNSELKIK